MTNFRKYVRDSSHYPAKRFRDWVARRDNLNADIMKIQWAIVWSAAILVFLLIGVAETVHTPQQVGLP